jgi:hypothetical protein
MSLKHHMLVKQKLESDERINFLKAMGVNSVLKFKILKKLLKDINLRTKIQFLDKLM